MSLTQSPEEPLIQEAPPTILWKPNPGPQTEVLRRSEKEILFGGSRGGGKSAAGIIFMLGPAVERSESGGFKYPTYRGLVLRTCSDDLADWIDKADLIYSRFGAKRTGRPATFVFPSGAKIVTNHLQDKGAYQKYQGQEFQRVCFEEATQIPQEDWYERLIGSCRSTIAGLDPQVFLTANPGNAGHQWVRNRFINVYGEQNSRGQWVMTDKGKHKIPNGYPFYIPRMKSWRIFIPATIEDNPILVQSDPSYLAMLDNLPEALRKAWRYGDWESFAGQYFGEFRPFGPLGTEPPEANHVIPAASGAARLEPWWTRWISVDWGFDHPAAVLWAAQNPNGRVHVYREYLVRQMGSVELGARIAEKSARDLEIMPEPFMTLSLDPSAWGKKDEGKTIAERIVIGIDKALGVGTAKLVRMDGSMVNSEGELASSSIYNESKKPEIIIRPGANQRVSGWQQVREMLRWNPLLAMGLDEVLPKVLIHDNCTQLIECLPTLVHDETNVEDVMKMSAINGKGGDDIADTLRYLLMAHSGAVSREPLQEFMNTRILDLQRRSPNGVVDPNAFYMVAQKAESDYKALNGTAAPIVSIPRMSSRRGKALRIGRLESNAWRN